MMLVTSLRNNIQTNHSYRFRTSASSNMSQNSAKSTGGAGGNYRKVFKPNFGDDSGPSTHSARTAMRQNSNSYSQASGKPPVKNRLQNKAPYNYRGMSRGDDDSEYHPTERKSGMRSSRITDSRERTKPNIGSMRGGTNNIPKASQGPKKNFGGMRSKPSRAPPKPSYGAPKQSYGDPEPSVPTTMGGMSHDEESGVRGGGKRAGDIYSGDFGDEAFERPQALKPCPS